MRLVLSALECDIDTSLVLPSNAAGIYIKKSLNVRCLVTLYISNQGHKLNKISQYSTHSRGKNYSRCQPGI